MTLSFTLPAPCKLATAVFLAGSFFAGVTATAAPAAAKCAPGPSCWGSVVANPNTTAYGYAYNYVSGRAANNAAQANCPGNCGLYVIFRNACGAIAIGNNGVYGWAWNRSRARAKAAAVGNCQRYGSGCQLRVWGCTSYSRP